MWSVEPLRAEHLSAAGELEELTGANGKLWFRRSSRERQKFGEAVVRAELMPNSVCADDWIAAIVDSAWAACHRALCDALVGDLKVGVTKPAAWPAKLLSAGSGAVAIGF